MKNLIPAEIEKYAETHSTEGDPLLQELFRETYEKTAWPQMLVGPLEGSFLRMLVRIVRARRILEIGTFTGYSALAMAEALPEDGELVTLDCDKDSAEIAKAFWARSGHGTKIKQLLGTALESLKTIKGPFDLVFMDADKENYLNYWEICLPLLRQGGLIAVDNVLWSGRVLHPREASDKAIARFNNTVKKDPRVEAVMLTVRDGVTLAWKK